VKVSLTNPDQCLEILPTTTSSSRDLIYGKKNNNKINKVSKISQYFIEKLPSDLEYNETNTVLKLWTYVTTNL
jgi:hypothetical protein